MEESIMGIAEKQAYIDYMTSNNLANAKKLKNMKTVFGKMQKYETQFSKDSAYFNLKEIADVFDDLGFTETETASVYYYILRDYSQFMTKLEITPYHRFGVSNTVNLNDIHYILSINMLERLIKNNWFKTVPLTKTAHIIS